MVEEAHLRATRYGGHPSPVIMSEGWWRRRESNPRPKARRRGTLHACPLLDSRIQREEAAKTAEYQTRYVSPLNAEPPFRSQPV